MPIKQLFSSVSPFRKRFFKFLAIAAGALIIAELLLGNLSAFSSLHKETRSFSPESAVLTDLERVPNTDKLRVTGPNPSITYHGIHQELTNFYWEVAPEEGSYELVFRIAYSDATRAHLINSTKEAQVLNGVKRTNYVPCQFFGETGDLRLSPMLSIGDEFSMGALQTNAPVPFQFSFLRVFALLLFAAFVYLLSKAPRMREIYRPENLRHSWTMGFGLFGFCLLLILVYFFYVGSSPSDFVSTGGDQLSKELVDAFRNGQLSLLDKPNDQLLQMEHPYQWYERIREGVEYKWDHLLFQGKYYSYYGIAPVLLLFLPYNLLTGFYFPTDFACLLFALLGAAFLSAAYFAFLKNWTRKIPLSLAFGGLLMLLMTSGALLCVARPMFYEAAETAGFCFFSFGLWQLFSSGVLTGKPIRLPRLFFSACGVSLAVLSRPTFAVYAIAALFFLGFGLKEYLSETQKKKGRRALLYLTASLLPYAVFGGVQMLYNYLRFGSFFDFGIQYSLTINDFRNTQFHAKLAGVSLWNLLFSVPKVQPRFPFFFGDTNTLGVNGSYFFETETSFGLLWRALPIFSLLYLPKLLKKESRKHRWSWLLLGVLPGLLLPLGLIAATWESGYALRYSIDFAWQMLLLSLAVCFTVYSRIRNEGVRRLLRGIFLACTIWCVLSNLALLLQHVPGVTNTIFGDSQRTVWYYQIVNLFSLS